MVERTLQLALLAGVIAAPGLASAEGDPPRTAAWLPYWDQSRGLASFEANADLYHTLSPFWYEFRWDLAIVPYPGAGNASVISAAQTAGVKLLPAITNNFDPIRMSTMLNDSTERAAHISALVSLTQSNGYDGIDIDYESMYASDRDAFTVFVTELAAALHAVGKELSVTVHAKTEEPGTWDGPQSQDWAAIGAVADWVRPMAYDYHWSTSTAGPITPVWWVEDVAAFAASVIPPEKVFLGLPLYGYDWVGSSGQGVTYEQAISRMNSNGAVRQWSVVDAEPWYTYGSHEVWYSDMESTEARLPIVETYGLAGVVFWRLGGEDPTVWPRIRSFWGCEATGPEVCDGVDNDCNGQTDEGVSNACGGCGALTNDPGDACGDCGHYICDGDEATTCFDPGLNACDACGPEPVELCGDGLDNDCDGDIDGADLECATTCQPIPPPSTPITSPAPSLTGEVVELAAGSTSYVARGFCTNFVGNTLGVTIDWDNGTCTHLETTTSYQDIHTYTAPLFRRSVRVTCCDNVASGPRCQEMVWTLWPELSPPPDCSHLDGECVYGNYDEVTETCVAVNHAPNTPCDDGDSCGGDSCQAGVCQSACVGEEICSAGICLIDPMIFEDSFETGGMSAWSSTLP